MNFKILVLVTLIICSYGPLEAKLTTLKPDIYIKSKRTKAIISGTIENYVDSIFDIEISIYHPEELTNEIQMISTKCIEGRFHVEIPLNIPRSLSMEINGTRLLGTKYGMRNFIFIEPGDSIYLRVKTPSDLINGITFSGNGVEKFKFTQELARWQLKQNERDQATTTAANQMDEKRRLGFIIEKDKYLEELLGNYTEKLNSNQQRLLKAGNVIFFYSNLLHFYSATQTGLNAIIEKNIDLEDLFRKIDYPELLPVIGGFDNIYLVTALALLHKNLPERKPVDYKYYDNHLDEYYELLNQYLKNGEIKDYYLAAFIDKKLRVVGLRPDIEICINKFVEQRSTNSTYSKQLNAEVTRLRNRAIIGKMIPDFEFKDTNNCKVALSDFKGKVVLLDFWYTGCDNCIKIQPSIKEIEDKFKKTNEFVVLSVSIDKNVETWKKSIGLYSGKDAVQLYTGGLGVKHPYVEYFNYSGYPSLVLLGKNRELLIPALPRTDTRSEEDKRKVIEMIFNAISK